MRAAGAGVQGQQRREGRSSHPSANLQGAQQGPQPRTQSPGLVRSNLPPPRLLTEVPGVGTGAQTFPCCRHLPPAVPLLRCLPPSCLLARCAQIERVLGLRCLAGRDPSGCHHTVVPCPPRRPFLSMGRCILTPRDTPLLPLGFLRAGATSWPFSHLGLVPVAVVTSPAAVTARCVFSGPRSCLLSSLRWWEVRADAPLSSRLCSLGERPGFLLRSPPCLLPPASTAHPVQDHRVGLAPACQPAPSDVSPVGLPALGVTSHLCLSVCVFHLRSSLHLVLQPCSFCVSQWIQIL